MPKVTLDLPDVPGYEYTGEYREALESEYFYHLVSGKAQQADGIPFDPPAPILRKLREFTEDAYYAVVLTHGPKCTRLTKYVEGRFLMIGTTNAFEKEHFLRIGPEIQIDWSEAPRE